MVKETFLEEVTKSSTDAFASMKNPVKVSEREVPDDTALAGKDNAGAVDVPVVSAAAVAGSDGTNSSADTALADRALADTALADERVDGGTWWQVTTSKGPDQRKAIAAELMPAGRVDVDGQTCTNRDHGNDPTVCSYAEYEGVGTETVYYANFSSYKAHTKSMKSDKEQGFNWYDRMRAMLKRNPFGIVVLNEATRELQTMMQEGEKPIPQEWIDAKIEPCGHPRPMQPYEQQARNPDFAGPLRKTDLKPERSFRCTLGDPTVTGDKFTNAVCVLDTHCAEHDPPGKGLKPPTVLHNEHLLAPKHNGNPRYSRITCFKVHMARQVAYVGTDLVILVAHFNNVTAKLDVTAEKKKAYYTKVGALILEHKPVLFCCDANMALLETIDMIMQTFWDVPEANRPRISVAAWYPYQFFDENIVGVENTINSGLGLDSLGVFSITYQDTSGTADAYTALAETSLLSGPEDMAVFRQNSDSQDWEETIATGGKLVRRFMPFSPNKAGTGYPGQHLQTYKVPKGVNHLDYLERFLQPRTSDAEIRTCEKAMNQGYKMAMLDWHAANRRKVDPGPKPLAVTGHLKLKQLRMDIREWVQDNGFFQQGTHMPLVVKIDGVCRRSETAVAKRMEKKKSKREQWARSKNDTALADNNDTALAGDGNASEWGGRYHQVNNKWSWHYYEHHPHRYVGRQRCVQSSHDAPALWCSVCNADDHDRGRCPVELKARDGKGADRTSHHQKKGAARKQAPAQRPDQAPTMWSNDPPNRWV